MNEIIYAVVKPPRTVIKIEQPQTQEQYQNLLYNVISKGLLLYHTTLYQENSISKPKMPWVLDTSKPEDSKPHEELNAISEESDIANDLPENVLKCPYCDKVLNSKSGKTLHIKNKHSDMAPKDDVLGTIG